MSGKFNAKSAIIASVITLALRPLSAILSKGQNAKGILWTGQGKVGSLPSACDFKCVSFAPRFCFASANNRTLWKIPVKKNGGSGYPINSFEILPRLTRIVIQVVKTTFEPGYPLDVVKGIPCLVVPGLEVGNLRAADAEHDFEHFDVLHASPAERIRGFRPACSIVPNEIPPRWQLLGAIGKLRFAFSPCRPKIRRSSVDRSTIINVHGLREAVSKVGIHSCCSGKRVHQLVHNSGASGLSIGQPLLRTVRLARCSVANE